MEVRLDPSSRVPLSEQLVLELRRRIEHGSLAAGERIPAVRELADRLGLAPNTVAKAYRALEHDGLLVARGRSGTFVADRPTGPSAQRDLAVAADAFVARAKRLGFGAEATRRALERSLRRR